MNDATIGSTKQSLVGSIGVLEKTADELLSKVSGSPSDQLKAENVPHTQGVVGISIRRIEGVVETLRKISERLEF